MDRSRDVVDGFHNSLYQYCQRCHPANGWISQNKCLLCQTTRCPSMLRSLSTYYRFLFLNLKFSRISRMNPGGRTDAFGEYYRLFLVSSSVFMYARDLRW